MINVDRAVRDGVPSGVQWPALFRGIPAVVARDAFTQLEDTDAQTGIAPGDPGTDEPNEGDK